MVGNFIMVSAARLELAKLAPMGFKPIVFILFSPSGHMVPDYSPSGVSHRLSAVRHAVQPFVLLTGPTG